MRPPRYAEEQTRKNEIRLMRLTDQKTGSYRSTFLKAMEILREHPRFYDKVVNNIHDIEIRGWACPYACIYSVSYRYVYGVTDFLRETLAPEANFNKKP